LLSRRLHASLGCTGPPAGPRQLCLAPSTYSITSSVRASSVAGISRPIARAVGRLMTNSNLVDCITGRSAGRGRPPVSAIAHIGLPPNDTRSSRSGRLRNRLPSILAKCGCVGSIPLRRCAVQESDCRHRRLLRVRRERPSHRRATDERNERASSHSITSSARCWSCTGTSNPRVFAVFRLITSSNLIGAWTGRSRGFPPRSTRSTYVAASRN
jgi:hypothetical protein